MPGGWFNILWRLLNSISHPTTELEGKATLYISFFHRSSAILLYCPRQLFWALHIGSPPVADAASPKHGKEAFQPAGRMHVVGIDPLVLPLPGECPAEKSGWSLGSSCSLPCWTLFYASFLNSSILFFFFPITFGNEKKKKKEEQVCGAFKIIPIFPNSSVAFWLETDENNADNECRKKRSLQAALK